MLASKIERRSSGLICSSSAAVHTFEAMVRSYSSASVRWDRGPLQRSLGTRRWFPCLPSTRGIGQLIGGALDRARPYEAMTGVHLLVDKTTDFSFPCEQATAAGAVAVGLLLTNPALPRIRRR